MYIIWHSLSLLRDININVMGTEGIRDRYVNPYTDFGFKLLFGTAMNKELLISFLNSSLNGREVIKDVTYLNAEHLGTQEYDRKAVFDVYCENESSFPSTVRPNMKTNSCRFCVENMSK